ncbi:Carbonic anhydrase [hydrothermal vent metagenome]|uniref:carbonic anhydrase n=1 Tax=hydrothermal vent metagenome TaxID=652676 RepID=A0A1W1CTP7_9ZZZZ
MKKTLSLLAAAALMCAAAQANESGGSHWGYTGHNTPETWGHLSEKYHACSDGLNQSPINITHSVTDPKHAPLNLAYRQGSNEVVNNGHTIQVNVNPGDTLVIDGKTFELKQFHFHSPSENHINGKSFPLEAHFVHLDKDGNIAVVAVMFKEGAANRDLAKIWKVMPKKAGEKRVLKVKDIAADLIPDKQHYYRFNGSLTTPPCTEGVRWFVIEKPLTVSKEQVEQFRHVMHHPNNRPVQPLDARVIVEE